MAAAAAARAPTTSFPRAEPESELTPTNTDSGQSIPRSTPTAAASSVPATADTIPYGWGCLSCLAKSVSHEHSDVGASRYPHGRRVP